MRDREKEFARRGVQLLTVIAHDVRWIKSLSGAKMPQSSPYPLLLDPTSTVSATYGAAFARRGLQLWTNRQITFVIDSDGVIRARYAGNSPRLSCMAGPEELRSDGAGYDLLEAVDDLSQQRKSIEALIKHGDKLRESANLALGPIPSTTSKALPVLLEALKSPDDDLRIGAASAINWIAPAVKRAPSSLVPALADERVEVRLRVILALGKMGSSAAVAIPQLVQALADDDSHARSAARRVLKQFGPASKASLVRGLKDEKRLVRIGCFSLLLDGVVRVDERSREKPVIAVSLRHKKNVKDDDLVHLKGFREIRALDLTGTNVTDKGLLHLKGFTNLEELSLAPHNGDRGLAHLQGLRKLRKLNVGQRTTDAGIVHLQGMSNLEELVGGPRITDAGVRHISKIKSLKVLRLRGSRVSDAGLAHLRGLHLRHLQLGKTRITDAGLIHLQHLPHLERLNIRGEGQRISDAGLLHLSKIATLKRVNYGSGTRITNRGVEMFEKALPDAQAGY